MAEVVRIGPMSVDDIGRVGEIDRTEWIATKYEVVRSADGLSLSLAPRQYDPPQEFPNWDEEGIARRTKWWRHELAGGGAIFGAFADTKLVGIAIVVPRRHATAEVLGMFVDAVHRRRGIGGRLLAATEDYARSVEAAIVYLHPNLTAMAVGFYRKHGYFLTCLVDEATLSYPEMEACIVLAKRV